MRSGFHNTFHFTRSLLHFLHTASGQRRRRGRYLPAFTSPANSSPLEIGRERWATAEKVAQKIICKVHPTAVSEQRRREVIDYVRGLIGNSLGAEVFPYGSVPLKTYLPDGDIDLSAFGRENLDDLTHVVEGEEENRAARFVVKDVQVINAEQTNLGFHGGLRIIIFAELSDLLHLSVDRLIGKDHLFKRSVILIKAWCYYESRILGAHHGLISTYALETDGVLYKFLDYFGKFDWGNYCLSLNGPIPISSLPAIVAETPVDGGSDLLLSNDFLRSCAENFSVPSRCVDRNSCGFQKKHLNIVDPLKETNNLGRSVSKGNFYRIRSAFSYGARKLGGILLQQEDHNLSELHIFFSSIIGRHRNGQPYDVQSPDPPSNCNGLTPAVPVSDIESCKVDKSVSEIQPAKSSGLRHHLLGDANDLATSDIDGLEISCDSPKVHTQIIQESVSVIARPFYAPHHFFLNSNLRNSSVKNGNPVSHQLGHSEKNVHSEVFPGFDERRVAISGNLDKNQLVNEDETAAPFEPKGSLTRKSIACSEESNHMICYQDSARFPRNSEYLNSLSDLTGDYDSYFYYLQYGRWCYEHASGFPSLPMPPLPPPQYESKNSWNGTRHSSQFKQNAFSHQHPNGFIQSPATYAVKPLLVPAVAYGAEEMPKPRGTGTYFPNTNQPPHGYRASMNVRNRVTLRSPGNNGRNMILETNVDDRSSHDISQFQVPIEQSGVKRGACDSHQSFSPCVDGHPNVNCLATQSEEIAGFGEVGCVPFGAFMLGRSRQQRSVTSPPQTPNPVPPRTQGPKSYTEQGSR
ncbi:PAP/OAS1 substrate-binding domain superfamily [Forsythia ovata]|uniref:PAP/OAS1 substrate-binding domain superfamily n=1 Tax=Forsythia ovata TaxID=205694 RepID=A0ABD1TB84_9LAMI